MDCNKKPDGSCGCNFPPKPAREPQFNSYGEAYAHMGKVYDMCQAIDFAVLPHECWKISGVVQPTPFLLESAGHVHKLEGAIAIIEGKPAFRGSKPYFMGQEVEIDCAYGDKNYIGVLSPARIGIAEVRVSELSWNPPKPKTISINGVEVPANYREAGVVSFHGSAAEWFQVEVRYNDKADAVKFLAALKGKKP